MCKTADRKNKKRSKELSQLAQENPELFERKLAKKVNSWTCLIWKSTKDRVFLTEEEYKELLIKYPCVKKLMKYVSVELYDAIARFIGVHIYLDALNNFKKELGSEFISEILSHAKRGTLIGERIFTIVDNAKKTLIDCGQKAQETIDLLENECCRALSPHIGMEIYRINQRWKPKE